MNRPRSRTSCTSRCARLARVLAACLGVAAAACADPRFALRQPVTHVREVPFGRRPAETSAGPTTVLDEMIFRPAAHVWLLERAPEARDVNSLDEVPDSSWFTNRAPAVEAMRDGACGDTPPPTAPFTVRSAKTEGFTPGLVAVDATGRHYVLKFEESPDLQPETALVADAVVSRLYWALGYNTPCYRTTRARLGDFVLGDHATETNHYGHRVPLTARRMAAILAHLRPGADGTARIDASLYVDGAPLGPWPSEGTRRDDPNDVIPHEDRRELRGERLLAAWVGRWDVRAENSLDSFVPAPGGGGLVRHWMLDFSDCLGALPLGDPAQQNYTGHIGYLDGGAIIARFVALGFDRPRWETEGLDPHFRQLGYYRSDDFDPAGWVPRYPMPRFARADAGDVGWMARRLARLTPAHVRAAIDADGFTRADVNDELFRRMLARRRAALAWAFRRSSPLADVSAEGAVLCASDLALAAGASRPEQVSYRAVARRVARAATDVRLAFAPDPRGAGRVCVALPSGRDFAGLPDDAPARYTVVDVVRAEGGARTTLRTHAYDLGARGYALVGIERP